MNGRSKSPSAPFSDTAQHPCTRLYVSSLLFTEPWWSMNRELEVLFGARPWIEIDITKWSGKGGDDVNNGTIHMIELDNKYNPTDIKAAHWHECRCSLVFHDNRCGLSEGRSSTLEGARFSSRPINCRLPGWANHGCQWTEAQQQIPNNNWGVILQQNKAGELNLTQANGKGH